LQLFCTQAAVILSATTFARNFCLPLPVTVPHYSPNGDFKNYLYYILTATIKLKFSL
jgi:hypothetical protein